MSIDPEPLDDDWLDEQLLADDTSKRHWARRALNGIGVHEALSAVPRKGQMLVEAPIGRYRELLDHIGRSGLTQSRWVRQAIGMRLRAEGSRHADWWLNS